MLIRLLAVLISVPYLLIGQGSDVDKPYEETGTFFDFNTGEYLLVTRENGNLTVRYSNGVKPFEDLIVLSDSAKPCCCEHIKCHSYSVAFKANPKIAYRLVQQYWEGLRIVCYNSKNKALNVFWHCSNEVISRPDPIKSVVEYWGGEYYKPIEGRVSHILNIEMKNSNPEFTLIMHKIQLSLIPEMYIPSKQTLTGKTGLGEEFSLRFHHTLPRNVSLKIAKFKPYDKEQWFEFGNQQK
jgi:hypothetical protein